MPVSSRYFPSLYPHYLLKLRVLWPLAVVKVVHSSPPSRKVLSFMLHFNRHDSNVFRFCQHKFDGDDHDSLSLEDSISWPTQECDRNPSFYVTYLAVERALVAFFQQRAVNVRDGSPRPVNSEVTTRAPVDEDLDLAWDILYYLLRFAPV